MPNDGSSLGYSASDPGFVDTYIKHRPYKHPLTATERLAEQRLEKRRARARRNGKRYKI